MQEQQLSLEAAATYILEECRMVLPGIQALFGFQLIAVFSDGFSESLARQERLLLSSRLLLAGTFPLALGLALDVDLITGVIAGTNALAAAVAGLLLVVFAALWLWLPRAHAGARHSAK